MTFLIIWVLVGVTAVVYLFVLDGDDITLKDARYVILGGALGGITLVLAAVYTISETIKKYPNVVVIHTGKVKKWLLK